MAIPADLSGVQLVVQAICRKPTGYVGSLSVVRSDRGAVAGDAFQKNLYITLPRGVTGCINDFR